MDFIRPALVLVFLALFFNGDAKPQKLLKRSKRNHVNCRPKSLVMYRLTVNTLWSKEIFPKMFPTYRPHAQWSSLVGRTHGPEFQMWEEGANATIGVKLFAEQGDPSQLNIESVQGYDDILDSFVAPPVNKSVGQTSTVIILDGHHSKLSFMMKIIPSPDWFIGVSSLDLCAHGRWKNTMRAELRPFDAGTDQGLTFTAPNWPNTPAVPIADITSSYPDHPASSFFYPDYKELPRLALLDLDIVSEFRHRETLMKIPQHYNTLTVENGETDNGRKVMDDEMSTTTVKVESKLLKPPSIIEKKKSGSAARDANDDPSINEDMSATGDALDPYNTSWTNAKGMKVSEVKGSSLKTKNVNEDAIHLHGNSEATSAPKPNMAETLNDLAQDVVTKTSLEETSSRYMTKVQDDNTLSRNAQTRDDSRGKAGVGKFETMTLPMNSSSHELSDKASRFRNVFSMTDLLRGPARSHWKSSIVVSTPDTQNVSSINVDDHQFPDASTLHTHNMHGSPSVDCEVGEWSEWSTCSQTCGFGQQERSRSVSRYPKNGGVNCPRLRQTNWCGSMRNCAWDHFSFLEPNVTKRQLREGVNRRRRIQTNKKSDRIN